MARSLRRRRALPRAARQRARSPRAERRPSARCEARVLLEFPPWRSVAVDMGPTSSAGAGSGHPKPHGLLPERWTSARAERSSAAAGEPCVVYIHAGGHGRDLAATHGVPSLISSCWAAT